MLKGFWQFITESKSFDSDVEELIEAIERESDESQDDLFLDALKDAVEAGLIDRLEFIKYAGPLLGLFRTDLEVSEMDRALSRSIADDILTQFREQVRFTWQITDVTRSKFDKMWKTTRWRVFKDGSCEVVVSEDPETTQLVDQIFGLISGDFDYSLTTGPIELDDQLTDQVIRLLSTLRPTAQGRPQ
jgi:hypothetical protein